ncbi:hypothetical protein EKH57_05530 [Halorubrum sp. BOL3-1]|uniref:hypothetical protein n=1 Tax=Halorubrum sp. BOL3-1 TaxID=2497325 RepID=UPI0010051469|nr:hypothetical protein [Halorubrum sp. BOL3-1]QAU12223.1 hypothetical protein EKH57_05530 [Halorubrum sp. BOL3-1]
MDPACRERYGTAGREHVADIDAFASVVDADEAVYNNGVPTLDVPTRTRDTHPQTTFYRYILVKAYI